MEIANLRIATNEADRNAAKLVELCTREPVPPDALFLYAAHAVSHALHQLRACGVRVFNQPEQDALVKALVRTGGVRVVVTCWDDENLQAQEVWTEDNEGHEQE